MTINELCKSVHEWAKDKGWVQEGIERNLDGLIALVHSELSEALEDWRIGRMKTQIIDGKPEGFPSEMADTVIRIADICAELDIDLEHEIELKMGYNRTRPWRHGGKRA